jgi:outer membrane protein insertion porin family
MSKSLLLITFILFNIHFLNAQNRLFPNSSVDDEPKDVDYARQREYEIADITVTGTTTLDPSVLISLSGLQKGDKIRIPGLKITEAIKKLWSKGLFGDVKIVATKFEGDKVYLNIQITERPRLTRFVFTGIRKGESEELNDKIELLRGTVITPSKIKNTRLAVEKFFKEKGYFNASANIIQIKDTLRSNEVLLKINVSKGKKVKIKRLHFEGNEIFEDKKIARKLKNTKQKKALRIFTPSKYIKNKYEEDKEKLVNFYQSQGYRDIRILSDTVYKVSDKLINVQIDLDEGKKYYYRNITWSGNYVYDNITLSRILGIKKGDIYDTENLEKRLNFSQTDLDITSLYMDDGYLFFRINPVEIAVQDDSIDIEMQIYEGQQADINKIIVSGNTKTNDKVILREIRTMPGQKFSRSALIRTQREISQMGYFDPEKIGINPVPNIQDGNVDVEYTLEEKPSDQIELSGGWGGAFGFVGTVGLVFNNFSARKIFKFKEWGGVLPSGDGQRLSLRAQANGKRYQTYSVTFTEPWLGGRKPNSFSISLSSSLQRTFTNAYSGEEYGRLGVKSITLSLGRRLNWPDNYFTLTNSVSYLQYQLKNYGTSIFSTGSGTSQTFTFNTTITRNSIDNPTFPRNGSSLALSLTLTPPFSLFQNKDYTGLTDSEKFKLVEYHKWMFDTSWFTQLVGNLVLHTRAHFGFIGAYNTELGVGPFERFVLGGSGLTGQNFLLGTEIIGLRGYADNAVTPLNQSGGIVYNKYVMELRYPVSLNPAATIFLLGFMEGGNNWGNYEEVNPYNLKRSAGFGARIFMPAFGMIGLDWGYGFDDIPDRFDVNKGRFHFTIGQQFR